ncbi:MAG: hypothetical protein PVSMB4_01100 [Ktedonobacterales bacterium]
MDPGLERRDVVAGRRSSSYVRIANPHAREFVRREPGHLVATERAAPPRGRAGSALQRLKRVLVGSPISTEAQEQERLTKLKALAVLSSDAISSVAYATEASMAVLITAGLGALRVNLILALCITTLMVIVGVSYRQTIHAYPNGGGSYIVARDNLGDIAGLMAAAALLIDYVLTVSVSVASGVDALVSALPAFGPYAVLLGVVFIGIIAVVNLRGVRESGTIFAAPTYLFIASFLIMILAGVVEATVHGGLLAAVPPTKTPGQLGWPTTRLGIVLVLSAFAQGCSAMTGTEAISNGVPAFKKPEARNAARTLEWMVATLVVLFLGTSYLAWRFGVEPVPSQQPTLDAQIAGLVFSGAFRWMFYLVQFATLLILVLAANTSFADFPRLSSILARDNFAPHQFRLRGDRLAFSVGIIVLALLSAGLLLAFQGNVNDLINLYALGVFTAFTLSQYGMVRRWLRLRHTGSTGWQRALVANGVGAAATLLVAGVIIFTKFDKGAWVVVVLVPVLVLTFRGIHVHYQRVREETQPLTPLTAAEVHHLMLVPIADLNAAAIQALNYARSLTPRVIAVHIASDTRDAERIRAAWGRWVEESAPMREASARQAWRRWAIRGKQAIADFENAMRRPPQFEVIESTDGRFIRPLMTYLDTVVASHPQATVTVIVPESIQDHWWQRLFNTQKALRLKFALFSRPGIVVTAISNPARQDAPATQLVQHFAVVPIGELNRPAIQSLAYARSVTLDMFAVHVATDEDDVEHLRIDWEKWVEARAQSREAAVHRVRQQVGTLSEQQIAEAELVLRRPPQLVVIDSPSSTLPSPLLAYIDAIRAERPEATVTVVLPEFIPAHWWERPLHNQTALRLKWALLFRQGVVVTDVPYHLPR